MHERHFAGALLTVCLLTVQTSAQDSSLSPVTSSFAHARLELQLPADWKLRASDAPGSAAAPRIAPGAYAQQAEVIVSNLGRYPAGGGLQAALAQVTKRLEQGSKVERTMPLQRRATLEGFPIVIGGSQSVSPEGQRKLRLSFAIAVGSGLQIVSLVASSEEAFAAVGKILADAVERARVRFPPRKGPLATLAGPERAVLHLRHRVPPALLERKVKEEPAPNRALLTQQVRLPGGKSWGVAVVVDLQPFVPEDCAGALRRFLYDAELETDQRQGSAAKVIEQGDFRLPDGLQVSGLVLEDRAQGGWLARRAGFVVLGPGWSLFVGAAIGDSKLFWSSLETRAQRDALGAALTRAVLPRLHALARSVRWGEAPKLRPELVQRLRAKGSYSYRREFSGSTSADFSLSTTNTIRWTFAKDGSCAFESSGSSHVLDTTPDARGRPAGSGLHGDERSVSKGKPRYQVIGQGGATYLLVRAPRGFARLHTIEFDKVGSFGASKDFKGLAIDGRIEGRYYSGNDYRFRKD